MTLPPGKGNSPRSWETSQRGRQELLLGTEDWTRGLPPTQLSFQARGSLEDGGLITGQSWEHGLSTFKIAQDAAPEPEMLKA